MQTFGLQEAADFLLMNKEVLRCKANTGDRSCQKGWEEVGFCN
jgi:hypothetical protein